MNYIKLYKKAKKLRQDTFLAFIQNRDDLFPYHVVQFLHEHPNFWNKYRPDVFRSGTHHANHLYRLGGVYAGSRGRVF
jgi:hypothetical protein